MNMNEYQNYQETKQHAASDFPYNTYLCSIPLDFIQVPLHWHKEMELVAVKKGQGQICVNFETRTVAKGDIVLILPGQLHSSSQKGNLRMEYENILFDPSMLSSGPEDLCANRYICPLLHGELQTETFLNPGLPCYQNAAACIREIDRLCDARPEGYQLGVKGWLFQLFYYLVLYQKNRDAASAGETRSLLKMKTVLKYVEEHYSDPITVEQMASLTGYSKSHFMKFFKQHMGTGFTGYLNDYRLTLAARLLRSRDDSILNIAADTGFGNLSYFNRLFRRRFGVTPGAYRDSV